MQQGLAMAGSIGSIVVDFSMDSKEKEPGGSLVLLLLSSNFHTWKVNSIKLLSAKEPVT